MVKTNFEQVITGRGKTNHRFGELISMDSAPSGQPQVLGVSASESTLDLLTVRTNGQIEESYSYGGIKAPNHAILCDLDLDGQLDVVATSLLRPDIVWSCSLDALKNGQSPVSTKAIMNCGIIVARDLNDDGWPEIVALSSDDAAFVVFQNKQGVLSSNLCLQLPARPSGLCVLDMDRDSVQDLILSFGDRKELLVLLGSVKED
jgi:hypothetical protein